MEDFQTWLRQQYDWPGAKYPTARQLALAISDGADQNALANIERNGLTTFGRARGLAHATDTSVLRILLMAGIVQESEVETISGQVLSEDQERAHQIAEEMSVGLTKAWLRSGVELLEYEQASR